MTEKKADIQESYPGDPYDRAARLLDGMMDPDVPEDIREMLRGWFKSGVSETEKYSALETLFLKVEENRKPDGYDYECLEKMHAILGFPETERPAVRMAAAPRRKLASKIAATAAAAMLIGGMYLWFEKAGNAPQPAGYGISVATNAGEWKKITLPDGSDVTLKANSVLAYAENFLQNRNVQLDGEAFFSVARDEAHPFTVESGNTKVKVLGTDFNVTSYRSDAQAEVVLVSGKVELHAGEETVLLESRQKANIDRENRHITVSPAGKGVLLRVTGGGLSFQDKDLGEALAIIADYFRKELLFDSGLSSDDPIYIDSPANTPLENIMNSISHIAGEIDYRIDGDTLYVFAKKQCREQ